ncbi:hypothetical protein BC939DRAFT_503895 [Gamsiella multidivaricata]|uniref:uncharacterized protein n=1 Tax=Gamsiella multidivaricata TaxID=101098 RepID=UPI00221F5031|nr:uncharacterized protein BC939DRAFT_503895 [Gamsiella multidivaricata]KAI7822396.1 hypothetical protein BC939DRAFT_503895 [Gamsiella multidivaricata]
MSHTGLQSKKKPCVYSPSRLRSLHFMNPVRISDQDRLANILYHCPNLVELRLGRNVRDLLHNVKAATEVPRELVPMNCLFDIHELQETVQTFASTLEVLVLDKVYSCLDGHTHTTLGLRPVSTSSLDDSSSTKKASLGFLSQILPRLPPTHLGLSTGMHGLFKFVNYETLRSVFVEKMGSMDLKSLWDALPNSQVESLSMRNLDDANKVPSYLRRFP